jgi:hypothetical protein
MPYYACLAPVFLKYAGVWYQSNFRGPTRLKGNIEWLIRPIGIFGLDISSMTCRD